MSAYINLPTSVETYRESLRQGIAFYQGNPVKNENKLNEAVAIALKQNNYDTLSKLMSYEETYETAKFTIYIDDENNCFVNDQLINPEFFDVFDEQLVEYKISRRDEEIDLVIESLPARRDDQKELLTSALKTLCGSSLEKQEFILVSIDYLNDYLAPNYKVAQFNEFCSSLLEKNKEFAAIPRCSHCYADLTESESVNREYYDKDSDETFDIQGRYVGKDECFESDEGLPHGRYDCHDDSDTCVACGEQI